MANAASKRIACRHIISSAAAAAAAANKAYVTSASSGTRATWRGSGAPYQLAKWLAQQRQNRHQRQRCAVA